MKLLWKMNEMIMMRVDGIFHFPLMIVNLDQK